MLRHILAEASNHLHIVAQHHVHRSVLSVPTNRHCPVQLAREGGATVILDCGGAEAPVAGDLLPLLSVLSPNETELARLTGAPSRKIVQHHTTVRCWCSGPCKPRSLIATPAALQLGLNRGTPRLPGASTAASGQD